jgi:hypothetical protein
VNYCDAQISSIGMDYVRSSKCESDMLPGGIQALNVL